VNDSQSIIKDTFIFYYYFYQNMFAETNNVFVSTKIITGMHLFFYFDEAPKRRMLIIYQQA